MPRTFRSVPQLPVFGDTDNAGNFSKLMKSIESLLRGCVERVVLLAKDTSAGVADDKVQNNKSNQGEGLAATDRSR